MARTLRYVVSHALRTTDTQVPPVDPPTDEVSPVSPHRRWNRIGWVDFRMSHTNFFPNEAARQAEYDNLATHYLDVVINGDLNEYKSRNPSIQVYPYDLFWQQRIESLGPGQDDVREFLAANMFPEEDAFLHFSPGQVVPDHTDDTGTFVPSHIATGHNKADRYTNQQFGGEDYWYYNLADPGFVAWRTNVVETHFTPNAQGRVNDAVFWDVLGFANLTGNIPFGSIVEYATVAEYEQDLIDLLTTLRAEAPAGRFVNNVAQRITNANEQSLIAASGGAFGEFTQGWFRSNLGWSIYPVLIANDIQAHMNTDVGSNERDGGTSGGNNHVGFNAGGYDSIRSRSLMFEYCSYLMNVNPAKMDILIFCPYIENWDLFSFEAVSWLDAYDVNIGLPIEDRVQVQSGSDPLGQTYVVWKRELENAIVYIRPTGSIVGGVRNYGDNTAVTVTLPVGTWHMLNGDGTVSAPVGSFQIRAGEGFIFAKETAPVDPVRPTPGEAVVLVDTSDSTGMQVWRGMDGVAQLHHHHYSGLSDIYTTFEDDLRDALVNDFGITGVRQLVFAGIENDADYYTAATTESQWVSVRGWGRATGTYHMASIANDIDEVVLPIKTLVEANGDTFRWTLSFQTSTGNQPPGAYDAALTANHQRVANTILEIYKYAWDNYSIIPDVLDVNEPDAAGTFTLSTFPTFLVTVAQTLIANQTDFGQDGSWTPSISAPSAARGERLQLWWNACYNNTTLRPWLTEIGYHLYDVEGGGLGTAGWDIANSFTTGRIDALGIEGYMSEFTALTVTAFYKCVVEGKASTIQKFSLAGGTNTLTPQGGVYIAIYNSADGQAARGDLIWGESAKLLRNYALYLRPGAQRKIATYTPASSAPDPDGNVVCFTNPDGKHVVIVLCLAPAGGAFWVDGLPAGTYGVNFGLGADFDLESPQNFTEVVSWDQNLVDKTLNSGDALQIIAPSPGVWTIYQK